MQIDSSLVSTILEKQKRLPGQGALLVGISGIDGSGKGFISAKLADELRKRVMKIALISADDWMNLPEFCITRQEPAERFYKYAIRFDQMFTQLVIPLRQNRSIDLVADRGGAAATVLQKQHYQFRDVDIILLEGIFLFKPAYRDQFDLKVWIDCSFDTALRRAIARGQERLPPAETKHAFETIYFPAQQLHFRRDQPREIADIVFDNGMEL